MELLKNRIIDQILRQPLENTPSAFRHPPAGAYIDPCTQHILQDHVIHFHRCLQLHITDDLQQLGNARFGKRRRGVDWHQRVQRPPWMRTELATMRRGSVSSCWAYSCPRLQPFSTLSTVSPSLVTSNVQPFGQVTQINFSVSVGIFLYYLSTMATVSSSAALTSSSRDERMGMVTISPGRA